ncbi:MAG: phosphoglucomutase (alpha-D-glucose-1,6-bisphosphate-dependent) [Bacteroidetes bacterium]|nr:phosphoglucomutase (alpha-D-glucose-1,6-bisphosphate-dependent) [Bacteroidota bacterium]
MSIHPNAGQLPEAHKLVNIPRLISAYYSNVPDPSIREHRVAFGTSGHRGSSLKNSFNENHILAICQAVCLYRQKEKIEGPVFIGIDTHALSTPAFATTVEVMAANGMHIMISKNDEYTPTPAVSQAILMYNKVRKDGLADGIVITPSHNPPDDGGFKYNPPHGGPAGSEITSWIEAKANEFLENDLKGVLRIPYERALKSATTHRYDYIANYVSDLANVIDFDVLRDSNIAMGVDPMGGAGVDYWGAIADNYRINLTVVNEVVDPTFRFMTLDWDGKIRMDPSSSYAMQGLIAMKDQYDISFGCDTDHDRHGIVTRSSGLMQPNHYLAVCINYLFQNRSGWSKSANIGKTLVSSNMIDRVASKIGRKVYEVPVGFKWFVDGLIDGSLGFVGEESAGASFLRKDGGVWTTDKDGLIPALLSAEITARTGKDPGEHYLALTKEFGAPVYDRIDAAATPEQKQKLSKLSPEQIPFTELAGEKITAMLTKAPGNGAELGGLKVVTENGWFAARPSGTENIYKIYAESFKGEDHLRTIQTEAQTIVSNVVS